MPFRAQHRLCVVTGEAERTAGSKRQHARLPCELLQKLKHLPEICSATRSSCFRAKPRPSPMRTDPSTSPAGGSAPLPRRPMTSLTVPTDAKQIRPPLPCCSRKPVRVLRGFSLPAPPCLSFPWHRRSFCASSASPCPSRLPDADAKQNKTLLAITALRVRAQASCAHMLARWSERPPGSAEKQGRRLPSTSSSEISISTPSVRMTAALR